MGDTKFTGSAITHKSLTVYIAIQKKRNHKIFIIFILSALTNYKLYTEKSKYNE